MSTSPDYYLSYLIYAGIATGFSWGCLLAGRFYHCCSSKEERKQRFEQIKQTYSNTLPRLASVVESSTGSDVRLRFVNPFAPETKHTTTSQYMQSISTSLLGNNHKLGGIGAPLGKLGGLKSR